ncbi:hypothetical protein LLEC1_01662 [Akanthomyces lecanii]|uniref:Protein phosphatase methylesterase 1 n=1 Tax=Cordyceps confragosa TaxID=2714763 RepID=A0A179I1A3_CORDF|nr:hypothetical protein LLEC1_01662 [Akanthomyces lecanii]
MSDLQRAWAKAKLGIAHDAFDEAEEEYAVDAPDDDSSSASSASSVSSTGTIVPTANQRLFARPNGVPRGRTLEPIPWTTYFERELYMEAEDHSVKFHAYLSSPVEKGPLFVMHHGAGSSGLSFALVGSEIRKRMPSAGILAVDCRGHGSTTTANESDRDGTPGLERPWRWRTNLAATQPFWEGWFVGLSKKFLAAPGGKLLLLAGTDRLDTELTIGQMQGKYNLQVFPEAGHFIHEDMPEQTAVSLVDFYKRNDRSKLVLPPKVSDLLRQGKKV